MISCHNNNLKSVHADYIYHKNEIGKSGEMSLSILKKGYHTNFYRHDIYIFIAESTSSGNRKKQSQLTLPSEKDYWKMLISPLIEYLHKKP